MMKRKCSRDKGAPVTRAKGDRMMWKDGQVSKKQALHLTWLGRLRPGVEGEMP